MPRSSCRQQLTNLSIRQQRRSVNSSKQEDLKILRMFQSLWFLSFQKTKQNRISSLFAGSVPGNSASLIPKPPFMYLSIYGYDFVLSLVIWFLPISRSACIQNINNNIKCLMRERCVDFYIFNYEVHQEKNVGKPCSRPWVIQLYCKNVSEQEIKQKWDDIFSRNLVHSIVARRRNPINSKMMERSSYYK